MSYPNITFSQDAKRDFQTLQAFAAEAEHDGGRNLQRAVFDKEPSLAKYFNKNYKIENEKFLRSYIDQIYRSEKAMMSKAMTQHQKCWERIAPTFFQLVEILFDARKWPKGKYIAFGTIWHLYPRFLEDKTFQIPFKHKTPKYIPVIIAHELLHFMFYDYFCEQYGQKPLAKNDFLVWHVSEIFNTVIQGSPEWIKHFGMKSMSYPEHEKIVNKINRDWYDSKERNVDSLIGRIMKEVQGDKTLLQ